MFNDGRDILYFLLFLVKYYYLFLICIYIYIYIYIMFFPQPPFRLGSRFKLHRPSSHLTPPTHKDNQSNKQINQTVQTINESNKWASQSINDWFYWGNPYIYPLLMGVDLSLMSVCSRDCRASCWQSECKLFLDKEKRLE